MPDAWTNILGLKDFAWKVWRKKFTNLEEAMVYAEELDLEVQQKSIITEALAISQSAQIMKVLSHPVRYLSVTVGQDLTPRRANPMELGLMK
jgi:hypothetical protein